jgi:ubiquinone/menaquinone biosynthesis C-methylase UbiE
MSELIEYYRKWARDYEEIYHRTDPHRQEELEMIASAIQSSLRGRVIIDLACGTGWWDRILSETAKSIIGLDINNEVLEIAKGKKYKCPVKFMIGDAFQPHFSPGSFDGALATFWISHIPKKQLHQWIDTLHTLLQPGSRVFLADNMYIPNLTGPIIEKQGDENKYKHRILRDGSHHDVLKNYYSRDELVEIFSRHVPQFDKSNVFQGHCFYWVDYQLTRTI